MPSAVEKPPKRNGEMDLDTILKELGQFGKYQLMNYLLICVPILLTAAYTLSYVFTAGHLQYRCRIPECDATESVYAPTWLPHAVPYRNNAPVNCERYPSNHKEAELMRDEGDQCPAHWFDNATVESCDTFVYDEDKQTIVSEFNITCIENEWKLALVGTVNNIGQFVCLPFTGFMSDRFGRRNVLVFGIVASGLMGLIRSFSTSYYMFLLMEFLDPSLGSGVYGAGFILGMELVGPKKRVLGGAILSCFYALGEALLGVVAWQVASWRNMLRIFYAPALLGFAYLWLIPESVRWLSLKGRKSEVAQVIKKAARLNGVTLSDNALMSLSNYEKVTYDKLERVHHTTNGEPNTVENPALVLSSNNGILHDLDCYQYSEGKIITETALSVCKSPMLLLRVANCSFCWLTSCFVYYGLSLNSVSVNGNSYMNFILVSLIEVPGYVVTYLIGQRLGRRTALCASLLMSGLACIAALFVPDDMAWMRLVLFLFGKFAITISFTVLYVYTTELFPTSVRHSLLGTCSMFGRVGSMIAPQTPLLGAYMTSLPLLLFGGTAVASGLMVLNFPETLNSKLPDTIADAENIGKKGAVI